MSRHRTISANRPLLAPTRDLADLVSQVLTRCRPHWFPSGISRRIAAQGDRPATLDAAYLAKLGIPLDTAAKIPNVVIHGVKRNWLILIEAVTSAGPVDGKRRWGLKQFFTPAS